MATILAAGDTSSEASHRSRRGLPWLDVTRTQHGGARSHLVLRALDTAPNGPETKQHCDTTSDGLPLVAFDA